MGLTRLSSGQIKILYTSQGSNEVKWTWLSKGQLKKVFGKIRDMKKLILKYYEN